MLAVSVTKGERGAKMEAPTAAKMEAGCGARSRRLLGIVVWPLPPLRFGEGNGNYKSRRAGRGGGGAVLCVRLEEPEAEEKGLP